MKKTKYSRPKITKVRVAPRFLMRRKSGFGGDVLMSAVWAVQVAAI